MSEDSWHTATPKQWDRLEPIARALRHQPTRAENLLWQQLRNGQLGVRFRRQQVIDWVMADFSCLPARLVVEVDGPVHDRSQKRDTMRDARLAELGFQVLRFRNEEVESDIDDVLRRIRRALAE